MKAAGMTQMIAFVLFGQSKTLTLRLEDEVRVTFQLSIFRQKQHHFHVLIKRNKKTPHTDVAEKLPVKYLKLDSRPWSVLSIPHLSEKSRTVFSFWLSKQQVVISYLLALTIFWITSEQIIRGFSPLQCALTWVRTPTRGPLVAFLSAGTSAGDSIYTKRLSFAFRRRGRTFRHMLKASASTSAGPESKAAWQSSYNLILSRRG